MNFLVRLLSSIHRQNSPEFANAVNANAEYVKLKTSAVSEHLTTCEHARHIGDLHNLYDNGRDLNPDKPFSDYKLTQITLKYCSHFNTQTLISYSFWKRFI